MNRLIRQVTKVVLATGFVLSASIANAELNINGFASVGGGWFDGEGRSATYETYDRDFSGDPVTKFGLQFSTQVNEKVSATGQLLAKGRNDYNIESEWAYLTYSVDSDWDVRVGRLRSPFFPYSDFLDVGYAYPWIAPPDQVYRFIFTTVEGVDTVYRTYHGDWDATYQAYYGRLTDETFLSGEEVDLDLVNFTGANLTLTKDWLTLRASYNQAKFSIESPSSLDGLLNDILRPSSFNESADALEVTDEQGAFYGIGALIDYNDWLVNAEYTVLDVDDQSAISADTAWYVMVGKRFDEFTYHLTYAIQEDDPDTDVFDEIPNGIAIPAAGITDLKQTVLDVVGDSETATSTLGMRYDFAPATSFKVEATYVDFKSTGREGTLINFAIDTVF